VSDSVRLFILRVVTLEYRYSTVLYSEQDMKTVLGQSAKFWEWLSLEVLEHGFPYGLTPFR
jgi:hypothetical protein